MILDIVKIGASLIDKIIPDKEAQAAAKLKLLELQQSGELHDLSARRDIIVAEAQSEHPLTSQWRPITMLAFVSFVGAHWFGFTAENLTESQILELLNIIKIGLGGYVIGRSGEKIARHWRGGGNDTNLG